MMIILMMMVLARADVVTLVWLAEQLASVPRWMWSTMIVELSVAKNYSVGVLAVGLCWYASARVNRSLGAKASKCSK